MSDANILSSKSASDSIKHLRWALFSRRNLLRTRGPSIYILLRRSWLGGRDFPSWRRECSTEQKSRSTLLLWPLRDAQASLPWASNAWHTPSSCSFRVARTLGVITLESNMSKIKPRIWYNRQTFLVSLQTSCFHCSGGRPLTRY